VEALGLFKEKLAIEKLPVFVFGGSSGGFFISILSFAAKFTGAVIHVAYGLRDFVSQLTSERLKIIYFSTMENDEKTTEAAIKQAEIFRSRGLETHVIKLSPRPLTPTYFSDWMEAITIEESKLIYERLSAENLLTSVKDDKAYLNSNPRIMPELPAMLLSEIMQKRTGENKSQFVSNSSHAVFDTQKIIEGIGEELNVLWGVHEMSSTDVDLWFKDFLKLC